MVPPYLPRRGRRTAGDGMPMCRFIPGLSVHETPEALNRESQTAALGFHRAERTRHRRSQTSQFAYSVAPG